MTGIVLCGGQSTRMGSDKGLSASPNGKNWAASAKEKLEYLKIPVFISINPLQYAAYSDYFDSGQLIPDQEDLKVKGPLTGIMSAHYKFPDEDLFFLACDMIHMDPVILKELQSNCVRQTEFDAYCFEHGGQLEPLCSIFRARALTKLDSKISNQELEKFSLKYVLTTMHTKRILVPLSQKKAFSNMNSPSDLHAC